MRISDWSSDVCSSDLIQNGSVNPTCKLKPEIHKEQGELHHADLHHGLELVGTDDEYQRDTDHESHLKERQRHGQRLAHDIHRGKKTDRTNRDAKVAGGAGHDIGQRLVDLAAIVGIDRKSTRLTSSH